MLQIIREESYYYFYPQFNTEIMNEGWASYWHAKLFHLYDGVSPEEMIEFARLHAGVVNPGGRYSIEIRAGDCLLSLAEECVSCVSRTAFFPLALSC